MKVTPIKKKFGKYEVGTVFDLPDNAAKVFIKVGKLRQADATPQAAPTYQTRMMQAEPIAPAPAPGEDAPYGYKADGTPRKRPGRPASE